ncbi:glycoside hydrolase family 32 protein [uncultured Sunxiuqinia sp.]|uniref:glycoside hydrolase family 32 protein n=1 Tax=uncultured Sunxiuqinia sp. TaxID=1573825 RepID=UPI00260F26FD|nr:glycoside hydrolase family 32 protein [uncultured Sunxiuqinia sp.]
MKSSFKLLILISVFFFTLTAKAKSDGFDEPYRPQFHFTPAENWMNDPNGLIYFEGEYHLFYQHNPNGKEWGFMHWGHAVSPDLVHWEHLPLAIYPDNESTDKEFATAFSGSAIVDRNNLLGKQQGELPTLLAFYTSKDNGQRIAYSTDKGRSWEKYEGNPVVAFDEEDDARDPKVFWHEDSQRYVMVLWRMPEGQESNQGISIYSSENLTDWMHESHLAGFYECPDLVELPVNRRADDTRWVIFDGDGSYLIGDFDGKRFKPETPKMQGDFGKNFYATQTFNNLPDEQNRTIQLAWMRGGEYPDMAFNGQMTFPTELALKKYLEGIRLVRTPVKEIELLHEKGHSWENENLIPGLNKNLTRKIKGDCLHIKGTFDLKTVNSFGFVVRNSRKETGVEIRYDATKQVLSCMGQGVLLSPEDNKIQLEILIDRTSIELFGNDGKAVLSSCYTADPEAQQLILYNTGGELLVEQLEIYPLKSMYELD